METYTSKWIRILIGFVVLALATKYVAREDWFREPREVQAMGAVVFVGALLLVSGVLSALRLRRERRQEPAAAGAGRTGVQRLVGVVVTAGLAGLLAGGLASGARVLNVTWAEQTAWRRAQAKGDAEAYSSYVYTIMQRHQPLAEERVDEDAARRASKAYRAAPLLGPMREGLHRWSIRAKQPGERASQPWKPDLSGLLDRFTPVREHVAAADAAYDDARFQEATAAGTASALRIYRMELAGGRHVDAARDALRALYREAEQRYAELIAGGQADPASSAGIQALLAHLREQDVDALVVPVCFLPVAGLEGGAIEQAIRDETGGKVVPVSPVFTAERNAKRERGVVQRMDKALRAVVGDLFELRLSDPAEARNRARFLVQHEVLPTGAIYQARSQDELPVAERTLFVGIAVAFTCSVQVPADGAPLADDPGQGHRFTLLAKPAPSFSADRGARTLEQSGDLVYGTMVQTAFADFERALIESYGLSEPKSAPR